MRHGNRGKPFVFKDNITKKLIIVVEETRYDAGYDDFYEVTIVLDTDPSPAEIFKTNLANPKKSYG